MAGDKNPETADVLVDRRRVFTALAAGSVASAAGIAARAAEAAAPAAPASAAVTPPSAAALAAEHEAPFAAPGELGRTGADDMVDCLRHLQIDYIATMPGSSFRGLHESLINYGGNKSPEILTCLRSRVESFPSALMATLTWTMGRIFSTLHSCALQDCRTPVLNPRIT